MVILAQFIKYLEENKLVQFDIIGPGFRRGRNRFRIQKHVFLAKYFGLDFSYDYDIYEYGPYSRKLARDYHELAINHKKKYDPVKPNLPESFHSEDFLNFVKNKDLRWLDVAVTLINCNPRFPNRNDLVDCVERVKFNIKKRFIISVLNELKKNNYITLTL
jgi:uncharacterized protein YwgA